MKFFTAVKIWNEQTKSSAWCVPRKGTPEYNAVRDIMNKKEPKEEKKQNIIEPPKSSEPEIIRLYRRKEQLDEEYGKGMSIKDNIQQMLNYVNKEKIEKDDGVIAKLKQIKIEVEPIPKTKKFVRVANKEEARSKLNKMLSDFDEKNADLTKELRNVNTQYKKIMADNRFTDSQVGRLIKLEELKKTYSLDVLKTIKKYDEEFNDVAFEGDKAKMAELGKRLKDLMEKHDITSSILNQKIRPILDVV